MPPAAALLLAAGLGGAAKAHSGAAYSSTFLVLHVGLLMAAFAGFTLSAGLAAIYLWQELFLSPVSSSILTSIPINLILIGVVAGAAHLLIERPSLRLRRWAAIEGGSGQTLVSNARHGSQRGPTPGY